MIDISKILRRHPMRTVPRVPIKFHISTEFSAWLIKKGYSPRGLLSESAKQLGYEGKI